MMTAQAPLPTPFPTALPTTLPTTMRAWVVREERHGDPIQAMQIETVPVPTPGPNEVIVAVKAAGINYNHIWACKGVPLRISQLHGDDRSRGHARRAR